MANSNRATSMRLYIEREMQRLLPPARFQGQPMDDAAIYEAYMYTCVVEAVEFLQRLHPRAGIRWDLVSPPNAPNQLILRKKACSIASATNRYSYVRIYVGSEAYELHTDVPVEGRSGVLSELDVALLRAEVCDAIRRGEQLAPQAADVLLLIEAKCYSATLDLAFGREFLGLYNTEFRGQPIGCLVSTAENNRVHIMLGYHEKRQQPFWPGLNDTAANRQAFVDYLARRLSSAIITPRRVPSRQQQMSRRSGAVQPPLPQCD